MDDKKMFAPLRHREAMSPESKLCLVLREHAAGSASTLADALMRGGLAVGTRAVVTKRVEEMLDRLEQEGKIKRLPDGRYGAATSDR